MNAPLSPEVLATDDRRRQRALPLASEGVWRDVWESRFGPILIEVVDGQVFVNGELVDAAHPQGRRRNAPAWVDGPRRLRAGSDRPCD